MNGFSLFVTRHYGCVYFSPINTWKIFQRLFGHVIMKITALLYYVNDELLQ